MIPIVVIAGPTASGKTALSIELAKRLNGEIISCDSMQIYKELNIGTAKPTKEEMQGIPHHMLDFLEPEKNFSVADFCTMAHNVILDIHERGKLPILAGGTGLYIDSLVNNVDFGEESEKNEIRERLNKLLENEGKEALYELLKKVDPESAENIHPNNVKRVMRAIEFYEATGMTICEHSRLDKEPRYKSVYFCIDYDREVLYDRINRRVDIMLDTGLLEEAKSLYSKYSDKKLTSMQSIGYKEFFEYFNGEKSLDEAIEEVKMGSRRYAKRQITWFKRNQQIHWLAPGEHIADDAEKIIKESLN